jgi:hypothetical protein
MSLPVAMTSLCAQLNERVCELRPMSGCGRADRQVGVSSRFAVHASAHLNQHWSVGSTRVGPGRSYYNHT